MCIDLVVCTFLTIMKRCVSTIFGTDIIVLKVKDLGTCPRNNTIKYEEKKTEIAKSRIDGELSTIINMNTNYISQKSSAYTHYISTKACNQSLYLSHAVTKASYTDGQPQTLHFRHMKTSTKSRS